MVGRCKLLALVACDDFGPFARFGVCDGVSQDFPCKAVREARIDCLVSRLARMFAKHSLFEAF